MVVRPIFWRVLAVVVALFLVVHLGQATYHIIHSKHVLSEVQVESTLQDENHNEVRTTWEASTFLRETLNAAARNKVRWQSLQQELEGQVYVLTLGGDDSALVSFYSWFEKHAGIAGIEKFYIHPGQPGKLVIAFHW